MPEDVDKIKIKEIDLTIEELQKRIIAITNDMQVVKANYARLEGHLSEAQHWLSEKLKGDSPKESVEDKEDNEVCEEHL